MSETAKPRKKREKVEQNRFAFDMRRPHLPESVMEYAKALAEGGNPSPNKGVMTVTAYNKLLEEQKEARKAGKPIPSMPPIYQPVIVGQAMRTRARFIMNGQPSKNSRKPSNWEDSFGEWEKGNYVADPESKSARMPRRAHRHLIRTLVTDPDNNIVHIGRHDFIIGDDGTSAIHMVNGSKSGNYKANIAVGKKIAFAETDGLTNIVGRINNNIYLDHFDDGTTPGAPIIWGEGMCVQHWGYLIRNDRKLSYAQIRKAVEDKDLDGISFQQIEQPIVGVSLTKAKLFQEVRRSMSLVATKDENDKTDFERFEKRGKKGRGTKDVAKNAWVNIHVQCRTEPSEMFPYGFGQSQTGIVPCAHYGDSLEDERVTFVIGARVGAQWTENAHQARRRLNPVEAKVAKPKTTTRKAKSETATAKAAATVKASAPASKPARPKLSDAERKARKAANDKARRAKNKAAKSQTATEPAATETPAAAEAELANA